MQPFSLLKAVKQYSFNLSKQLQQYTEVQSGKAFSQECKFQQVQIEKSSSEDEQASGEGEMKTEQYDDFHLETDQQNVDTGSTIKTYQFNSGMFAPGKPGEPAVEALPDVEVQLYEFFGFNSKERNTCVLLSQNYYCLAFGCSLILCSSRKEDKVKPYKMFREHVYEVSRLYYSPKDKILVSGSKGLKPQVIIWSFQQGPEIQKATLSFTNSFKLPRKCQGIGLLHLLNPTTLLCTDSVSIHRGNQLRCFDLEAGIELKTRKKWEEKVLDWTVAEDGAVYVATNKGVLGLTGFKGGIQMKGIGEKKGNLISIACYKNYLITGDQEGTLEIMTLEGKSILKSTIHKGLIFNISIILENQTPIFLTTGTEDKQTKLHRLTEAQQPVLTLTDTLTHNNYCTSLSSMDSQNILLAFRDGSLLLYDSKNKMRKMERLSLVSCLERPSSFLGYSRMSQKIVFGIGKGIYYQIPGEKYGVGKQPQGNRMELKKYLKCVAVFDDKILQLTTTKDRKYLIQVNSLANLAGDPETEGKIDLSKEGKPKVVTFNEEIAAIGTKTGFIAIYILKKAIFLASTDRHSSEVEDIIFQEGSLKPNQPFYIKSISRSELFYWEIQLGEQPSIKTINKAGPLKNLSWCSISKYCWDTRNIWEEMTHYEDIQNVARVMDKFICISMNNGTLRVYRFPATKNNFIETKLFPDKFNLISCGKNNEYLLCEKNCQFLLFKLRPKSN